MNKYMLYKEIVEILGMCKEAGFDLYEVGENNTKHILEDMSDIVKIFHGRTVFDFWISQEGPCVFTKKEEICIIIDKNIIAYRLTKDTQRMVMQKWRRNSLILHKEEIPEILKRWVKENENEQVHAI